MGIAEQQRTRLILVSGAGTTARQLELPQAFPLWVILGVLLSVLGSLLVGRQARAWFDPAAADEPTTTPWLRANVEQELGASFPQGRAERYAVNSWGLLRAPEPVASRSPEPAGSTPTPNAPEPTELSLFDVNAHKSLVVRPFDALGRRSDDAFGALRSFMRCRRTGAETDMDPRLVRVLLGIARELGGATLHVISGHRAPDGVVTSPSSQHVRGTAADIRVPGVSLEVLERLAHEQGARGVGVYTRHRFVHVDVRERAYSWREDGSETSEAAARISP